MSQLYSCKAVQETIDTLTGKGWDMLQLDEGGVGYGHIVLLAPDDQHYNFEITEVYLNCWSSGHTIRRFAKASKRIEKDIDAYYARICKEESA